MIKLKDILNEDTVSQDAYALHRLANNVGQDSAAEFLSYHDVDLELLAKAVQQKTINKYEIRDVVKGTAHYSQVNAFMKNFVKDSMQQGDTYANNGTND